MDVKVSKISDIIDNDDVCNAYKKKVENKNSKTGGIISKIASTFNNFEGVYVEGDSEYSIMIFVSKESTIFASIETYVENAVNEVVASEFGSNTDTNSIIKTKIYDSNVNPGKYVMIKIR